jgi:hypothetical protein
MYETGMLTEAGGMDMDEIDEKDQNEDELHTILHPDLKYPLNGIIVNVSQTGAGKSRWACMCVIKLKYINHPYHQFLIISDEENDKTIRKYKKLITIPVEKVTYDNAYERLVKLIKVKNAYEKIVNKKEKVKLTEKEKECILKFLGVKDFNTPVLHTIILFDDATDLFSNPKNKLNSLILKNRHHKFTYFFNIHYFTKKAIPMMIKKNMNVLCYFGGYTKLDFNYSYLQFKSPIEKNKLYNEYKHLNKRDILYFHFTDNGPQIEVLNMSNENKPRVKVLFRSILQE